AASGSFAHRSDDVAACLKRHQFVLLRRSKAPEGELLNFRLGKDYVILDISKDTRAAARFARRMISTFENLPPPVGGAPLARRVGRSGRFAFAWTTPARQGPQDRLLDCLTRPHP